MKKNKNKTGSVDTKPTEQNEQTNNKKTKPLLLEFSKKINLTEDKIINYITFKTNDELSSNEVIEATISWIENFYELKLTPKQITWIKQTTDDIFNNCKMKQKKEKLGVKDFELVEPKPISEDKIMPTNRQVKQKNNM